MRIVDANDAVNRFEELKPKGSSLDVRYAYGVSVGLEMAKHVIMSELSTVDAVPVRHGRWLWRNYPGYQYQCDQCKRWAMYESKFCPECGARMDGKDGEDA